MMYGVFLPQHHAVLRLLSFTSLLTKVNHSDADAQVVFFHCYPVIFHPIVKQLTFFISLDLLSSLTWSSILRVLCHDIAMAP